MEKLILAQGANHIKPEKMKDILNTIGKERIQFLSGSYNITREQMKKADDCESKIVDIYGCDYTPVSPLSFAVEEKYDGYSYLNCEGRFFSKRLSQAVGKKGTPVEKTAHLYYMSEIFKKVYEQCGADLHGEIYKLGGISDDVTKILGCTESEAILRQSRLFPEERLHYMLIDIRAIHGKSLINEPHRLRRAILKWVYTKYIKPIDTNGYVMLTEELSGDPQKEFSRIVRGGGEGLIIKREDALYIPDKKPTNNWIKAKKQITHDVVMMGLNDGTGKNENLFGSIRFGHVIDNILVECGNCSSGLEDNIREYIYKNADELIANHQVFEIQAIQESLKSFRNAVFLRLRDDKDWTECIPESIRIKDGIL